jgi:hypothetical protein
MGDELRRRLGGGGCRGRNRASGKAYQLVPQRATWRAGKGNSRAMGTFERGISELSYKALTAISKIFLNAGRSRTIDRAQGNK